MIDNVISKLIHDKSCGIIVFSAAHRSRPLSQLIKHTAVVFRIARHDAIVCNATPNLPPGDLLALVIDDWLPRAANYDELSIQVHPDWKRAFRHSPSPFIAAHWMQALQHYPDADFIHKICDGITWGRSLSYTGDRYSPTFCVNRPKSITYKAELDEKIAHEHAQGFRSGPFRCGNGIAPPLFNIKCHPRSAAIKRFSKKVRLVIDMSAPYDGTSVNANCPDVEFHYVKLDHAGAVLKHLGAGTQLMKFDVTAAYKQIRLAIDDWCLQGELYDIDGTPCFDISTACNFGAKSSGFIWEEYGQALEFILRWSSPADAILRYVDDFLALVRPEGPPITERLTALRTHVDRVSKFLGVTFDKFGTPLEFWDRNRQTNSASVFQKDFIIKQLDWWANRRTCTKRDLDSLIGYLQFLTRVIPWGRAFLGRCIRLSCSRSRPRHHINLNQGFRLDIAWWQHVLPSWNGVSVFFDDEWHEPDQFEVDASTLGYGCYYFPFFYSEPWSAEERLEAQRSTRDSMPHLELLAIARATFGKSWCGRRILCRSDCLPACTALTKKYSPSAPMQRLIRIIGMLALQFNFDIRVLHIQSLHNTRADPLSRLDLTSFRLQVGSDFKRLSRIHPLALPSSIFEDHYGTTYPAPSPPAPVGITRLV